MERTDGIMRHPRIWVIAAKRLVTTVHKAPVDGTWTSIEVLPSDAVLSHPSAPVRLTDL